MIFKCKDGNCHIEIEKGEKLLITSKCDNMYFLEVAIDAYDDICFAKRQNLKYSDSDYDEVRLNT